MTPQDALLLKLASYFTARCKPEGPAFGAEIQKLADQIDPPKPDKRRRLLVEVTVPHSIDRWWSFIENGIIVGGRRPTVTELPPMPSMDELIEAYNRGYCSDYHKGSVSAVLRACGLEVPDA